MNDNQRNTRTLIVSFVVAVMALVPLRMIEASQETGWIGEQSAVLGEQLEVSENDWVPMEEEIIKVKREAPILEEPYAYAEEKGCLDSEVVEARSNALIEEIDMGNISNSQIQENYEEIEKMQKLMCAN